MADFNYTSQHMMTSNFHWTSSTGEVAAYFLKKNILSLKKLSAKIILTSIII
jgi:hypothetical protein